MKNFDLPTIEVPKEAAKVETMLGQDSNNISIVLVIPIEAVREMEPKKMGSVLRQAYNEVDRIAKSLNTTFGAENQSLLEKVFGKI